MTARMRARTSTTTPFGTTNPNASKCTVDGTYGCTIGPSCSGVDCNDGDISCLDDCASSGCVRADPHLDCVGGQVVAAAGAGQTVSELTYVVLDGTNSCNSAGQLNVGLSYHWTQVQGEELCLRDRLSCLSDPQDARPGLLAPQVFHDTDLAFSLVASNGTQESAPDTVVVHVRNTVNEPPTALATGPSRALSGAKATLDASGSTDPNDDSTALVFHWQQVSGPTATLETPDRSTTLVDVPSVALSETLAFEVSVFDTNHAVSTATVTLTAVTNLGAPVFLSTPAGTATVAEPYHYDTDDTVDVAGDRAELTFSVMQGPPGFSIEKTRGLVTWTPTTGGEYADIVIIAANAAGQSTQTLSVDVVEAPKFISTPRPEFFIGAPYSYGDSDGSPDVAGTKPLTWSLAAGPSGMRIDAATGHLTWTPETTDDAAVEIVVRNDAGEARQSFGLTRTVPTPPTIARTANLQGRVQQPYLYDGDGVVEVTSRAAKERFSLATVRVPEGVAFFPTLGRTDGKLGWQLGWMPEQAGTYNFTLALTALTAEGAVTSEPSAVVLDQYAFTVVVNELDSGSVAANAALSVTPSMGPAPLLVQFDASQSTSTDGAGILQHVFLPGAGSSTTTQQPQVTYIYERPGSYSPELEVWDNTGVIVRTKQSVVVTDGNKIPPHVRMKADALEGMAPLGVQFGCNCSDEDGTLEARVWQFGTDTLASTEDSPRFVFTQPGSYRVRLTVTDNDGLVGYDQATVVVKLVDKWPPLARIVTSILDGNAPAKAQLHADVRDPDGVIERLLWTLPDGRTSTDPDVQLEMDEPGYYSATLLAVDNDGLTAADAWTITIRQNDRLPPRIVSAPSTAANINEPYLYDVDSKLAAQGSRPLLWSVGKTLNESVLGAPSGLRIVPQTGEISWTPAAKQVGEQHVTIRVENSAGAGLQEFVIHVDDGGRGTRSGGGIASGCGGCSGSADDTSAALAALIVAVWRRSRRVLHPSSPRSQA